MGLFGKTNRSLANGLDEARQHARHVADDIGDAAGDAAGNASARLRSLIDELESTLSDSASVDVNKLRSQLQEKLDATRSSLGDTGSRLAHDVGRAFDNADDFVHAKPWQTIAAVAGIALVAGFLAARS